MPACVRSAVRVLRPTRRPMERVMTDERSEEEVNRRANEKARKRKAARDRILATKTIEKGLLIVHTGKGKGKSTAAFGLVVRALGNGIEGRRRPVREGQVADRRARGAGEVPRAGRDPHHGRGFHLGDPGPGPRHPGGRERLGCLEADDRGVPR